jgi:hypothetical protein
MGDIAIAMASQNLFGLKQGRDDLSIAQPPSPRSLESMKGYKKRDGLAIGANVVDFAPSMRFDFNNLKRQLQSWGKSLVSCIGL